MEPDRAANIGGRDVILVVFGQERRDGFDLAASLVVDRASGALLLALGRKPPQASLDLELAGAQRRRIGKSVV